MCLFFLLMSIHLLFAMLIAAFTFIIPVLFFFSPIFLSLPMFPRFLLRSIHLIIAMLIAAFIFISPLLFFFPPIFLSLLMFLCFWRSIHHFFAMHITAFIFFSPALFFFSPIFLSLPMCLCFFLRFIHRFVAMLIAAFIFISPVLYFYSPIFLSYPMFLCFILKSIYIFFAMLIGAFIFISTVLFFFSPKFLSLPMFLFSFKVHSPFLRYNHRCIYFRLPYLFFFSPIFLSLPIFLIFMYVPLTFSSLCSLTLLFSSPQSYSSFNPYFIFAYVSVFLSLRSIHIFFARLIATFIIISPVLLFFSPILLYLSVFLCFFQVPFIFSSLWSLQHLFLSSLSYFSLHSSFYLYLCLCVFLLRPIHLFFAMLIAAFIFVSPVLSFFSHLHLLFFRYYCKTKLKKSTYQWFAIFTSKTV